MGFFWGDGSEVLFILIIMLVIGMFVVTVVRGISQWNRNNHSPRLTVEATVVAKRADVSNYYHGGGDNQVGYTTTSTRYYVTFQVESGDRMELSMDGHAYGKLVEGDHGKLSFQGTRYLGFERG